jgi:hypothetical protein
MAGWLAGWKFVQHGLINTSVKTPIFITTLTSSPSKRQSNDEDKYRSTKKETSARLHAKVSMNPQHIPPYPAR